MTSSALPLPTRFSPPFRIPSRLSGVTSFRRFPVVGVMGDRGRLTSFVRGRSSFSDSSGDSGNEQGIGIMEQEVILPSGGAASASPGLHSTINGLSKWIVSLLFCSVVLLKHDAEALWTVSGSVFNAILSVTLKRLINQERPTANLRSDPGMPSSHAQSISFIVMFTVVSLIELLGLNKTSLTISGILLALGVYMSWLRVSQQLHTTDQVVVGGLVGTSSFLLWYVLWRAVISSAFHSFLIVRVLVILGAVCFSVAFVVHAIRDWLKHER